MSLRAQKIVVATGFIVALASLTTTDLFLLRDHMILPASVASTPLDPVLRPEPVSVETTLLQLRLAAIEAPEQEASSLLHRLLGDRVQVRVLLKNNDRLALLAWTESGRAKEEFNALRGALVQSFSPNVQGLRDERQVPEGKPPRDILTFFDPAISSELVMVIRVKERLFEIHVPQERQEEVQGLIEALAL